MNKTVILVIDDELENRRNLKLILEAAGYEIILAENGSEGVEKALASSPSLILCDVMMPKMNGHEVYSALSKDPKTSVLPFIFLTAKTDVEDIRAGLTLGADDYLLKPIKTKELLNTISLRLEKLEKLKNSLSNNIKEDPNDIVKLSNDSKILINYKNERVNVPLKDIMFIEADNQYTKVFIQSKGFVHFSRSLNNWEEILPDQLFIKIHRSTIINIDEVEKLVKWTSNSMRVYLKNYSDPLTISQRFVKKVKEKLHFV